LCIVHPRGTCRSCMSFVLGHCLDASCSQLSTIFIFKKLLLYLALILCISFLFLYCSAGKSFVAEVLMLRRILSSGNMAILVLPYVSICAEKVSRYLQLSDVLELTCV
jgi:hypothetical protein